MCPADHGWSRCDADGGTVDIKFASGSVEPNPMARYFSVPLRIAGLAAQFARDGHDWLTQPRGDLMNPVRRSLLYLAEIGDPSPIQQRARKYAAQGIFIGSGTLIPSATLWLLTDPAISITTSATAPSPSGRSTAAYWHNGFRSQCVQSAGSRQPGPGVDVRAPYCPARC
jgi:hypothetical protein